VRLLAVSYTTGPYPLPPATCDESDNLIGKIPLTCNTKPFPVEENGLCQIFSALASQPWAMLLDSAQADHPDSRYDILVANPLATLVTRGQHTLIEYDNQCSHSGADPLALLQQWQQKLLGSSTCSSLPFVGGALGYFGYDLGRRFESLPQLAEDDIGIPEMAVGIYNWALVYDHRHQQATLVSCGPDAAQVLARAEHWLMQLTPPRHAPFRLTSDWQANLTKQQYAARFDKVQQYLRSGDCYQINLTQRFTATYQGDEWQAYCRLREANLAPFSAFLRLPDHAILSISPERFLRVTGRQVQTKPIKGTRPRHADPEQDRAAAEALAASPKDRAENLMIVDLLRNDIGRVSKPGSVAVPELFAIESFPAVHHLVSTITSELAADTGAHDLLRACFPGGSITGAPKIRAMEIIEELEPQRRTLYCGSIGYLSQNGNMDTSITIRTLVAKHGALYCWAGGGIVADSRMEAEYQESFDKLGKILPLLSE